VSRILHESPRSRILLVESPETEPRVLKRFRAASPDAEKEWGLELPEIPGILRPVEKGRDAGIPWLALPYCFRGSLRDRLKKESRLSPAAVTFLLADVCRALEGLHAQGLVHRDLSPGNLLFDLGSNVVLADFGCLLKTGETPDIARDGLGTPAHAHPAQMMGAAATPAHDLYALGSICYEGLSGEAPYVADSPERLAVLKLRERPRPLAEFGIPEPLARKVAELMGFP